VVFTDVKRDMTGCHVPLLWSVTTHCLECCDVSPLARDVSFPTWCAEFITKKGEL